jgi:hypothetical protein
MMMKARVDPMLAAPAGLMVVSFIGQVQADDTGENGNLFETP